MDEVYVNYGIAAVIALYVIGKLIKLIADQLKKPETFIERCDPSKCGVIAKVNAVCKRAEDIEKKCNRLDEVLIKFDDDGRPKVYVPTEMVQNAKLAAEKSVEILNKMETELNANKTVIATLTSHLQTLNELLRKIGRGD